MPKIREAKHVNMMDVPGTTKVNELKAATSTKMGYIVREEPAWVVSKECVAINAGEIMARDIGRYVKFVERFGSDRASVRIIIGKLRQIYFIGEIVGLSVGAGDPIEYEFDLTDMIFVYGDEVVKPPLNEDEAMLDASRNRPEKS